MTTAVIVTCDPVCCSGWVTRTSAGGGAAVYVAVYVVAVAGAKMSCDRAPASDQLCQLYVVPPTVCWAGAVIVFREFWITVRVKGAVDVVEPTDSWSPVGAVANDRTTVLGSRRTEVVPVRPPLSVAVRTSSSQLGYS